MAQSSAPIAPIYRYFTADLLTNKILAEIPFRGVSWERALKAGGQFSGQIPVIDATTHLDIHDNTMPGQTALYVVRNGKCVWGGLIWASQYDVPTKNLRVSASEFPSYFHHRRIWKTWNHQYGGSIYYDDDVNMWKGKFDYGSSVAVRPGSTVKLEFYEPSNFKYNGYYRIASVPAPTTDEFALIGGFAVADLTSHEKIGSWHYFYTKENHGYSTGDAVTVTITGENGEELGSPLSTGYVIDVPGGAASNMFRVSLPVPSDQELTPIDGYTGRTLPRATYDNVTITVRQDAFDYVRTLIDAMFDDFVTIDFPNVYIEPGISWGINITNKEALEGHCILQTAEPHGVSVGQAVQIQDVGRVFDGEYEITATPSPTELVYARGGTVASTPVSPTYATITKVAQANNVVTLTTSSSHGFSLGQNVVVSVGGAYSVLDGTYPIMDIPSSTTFRYVTTSTLTIPSTTLSFAQTSVAGSGTNEVSRVEISNDVVSLELKNPVIYTAGDTVSITGVTRDLQIVEKSLDAPNSLATVETSVPHGLPSSGSTVTITGLQDTAQITRVATTGTSVTMATRRPHNFRKGNTVTIDGTDTHRIVNKQLTSNSGTLTTQVAHNIPVGAEITVTGLTDSVSISSRRIVNGSAILTTSSGHNFKVNDQIIVTGLDDRYSVASKEATSGTIILTTTRPHNVLAGSKIVVSGVGVPFDVPEATVDAVTATRIIYKVDQKYWDTKKRQEARKGRRLVVPMTVPLTKSSGTIRAVDSYYNGQFIITERTSTTVTYFRGGEDQPATAATGSGYRITGPSVFNGVHTVGSKTATTVTFPVTGSNVSSTSVPIARKEDEIQPLVSLDSVYSGAHTITATTAKGFTFSQTTPSAKAQNVSLTASRPSIFNGTRTVTGTPTPTRFTFSLPGYRASVLEEGSANLAFAKVTDLYDGTYPIVSVDEINNTISYAKNLPDYGSAAVQTRGDASVVPLLVVSSFGPFPGSADLDIGYASREYTGINLEPTAYRGFELKTVGDALDAYSDNINGFEYRVDCFYNEEEDKFTRSFVMIPIDFPNPPAEGEVSPIERFGADKLIFEYPGGSITGMTIDQSAEESATRFFAVGETDLGPEAGPNIGIATANELLKGSPGKRAWPLLDATETVSGVDDKNVLHAYARRYLSEASPPYTTLSLTVNGSIAPYVDQYAPGDWCSLIVDDAYVQMRLQSDLEPRNDVIVRKIDSYRVQVPDGVTYPEQISISLIAEWEVDRRG